MLQNRFRRILFGIFLIVIIFVFYCFYTNENYLTYRQWYPVSKRLVAGNHIQFPLSQSANHLLNQLITAEEINVFLDYSKKISIDPFLVEPFLLYNYLHEEDQSYFIKYNINPNAFKWNYCFNSFGLKVPGNLSAVKRKAFLEKICKVDNLNHSGFECTIYYGDDHTKEWYLDGKIENKTAQIPVSFLFNYKTNNHTIHLVLFYLRTRSLWTGKIYKQADVNDLIGNQESNFKFGSYEELFDDFNFSKPIGNVSVPEDPFSFLMEKNNSRLIECDRQLATNYYKEFAEKDAKNSDFVNNSLTNMIYFKEMMKDYKMPFWMFSGTLLGWYRQCNIISYTTDVDFGVDSRFASKKMTNSLMENKYCFKFLYIWGLVESGYEYTLKRGCCRADLFFTYPAHNEKVAISVHQKTGFNRLFYPKFNLCTGQLRGIRLNVPCNAKELLETEYGKDWVKPVSDWNYLSSSFNKGPTEYWPKGLITFRQFENY